MNSYSQTRNGVDEPVTILLRNQRFLFPAWLAPENEKPNRRRTLELETRLTSMSRDGTFQ
jgi:hypothetical protein